MEKHLVVLGGKVSYWQSTLYLRVQTTPHNEDEQLNLTYTINQVLCPKVQSKHGDIYHVLGTRQLLNIDRYNLLFGMLVSNRYLFVKHISVWNQTEKKTLQGLTFTLFFLYKSARYSLFRQNYLFDTYLYIRFSERPYICLTFLVSFPTHHHYSVLS